MVRDGSLSGSYMHQSKKWTEVDHEKGIIGIKVLNLAPVLKETKTRHHIAVLKHISYCCF